MKDFKELIAKKLEEIENFFIKYQDFRIKNENK